MRVLATTMTATALAVSLLPAGAGPGPSRPQPAPSAFNSVKEMTRTVRKLRKVRPKGAGGYLEAYLYQLQMRAFPNDSVDWGKWDAAAAHRSRMPAARIGASRGGIRLLGLGEQWQFMGPRNLATPYRLFYGEGKLSGRVNAVAYDAGHPGTCYLASSGGGVWKTTDSGANWTPLSDGWTYLKASSIALDPVNTSTVYVGTGDFDGSSVYCMGIMKSTDGGASWTNYGRSDFGNTAVSALIVDPDAPNTLLAATGRGRTGFGYVWRSTDAGVTWSPVVTAPAAWSDLKVGALPASGGRAYYATGLYSGGQMWRSTDQGATWTKLNPPLTPGTAYDQNSLECAASPTAPGVVYLVSGYDQKVWKSAAYGADGTWTDITGNFPNGTDNYNWSQRWYDIHAHCTTRTVAGSPVDVLYVGLITLSQSLSGDAVWRDVGLTYTNSALTHNDAHSMAFDPTDPNKALVGNDGGVFGYTYNPAADSWSFDSTLSSTLGVTEFYRIAPHPTNPDKILGGTQDNASPLSTGDLMNWRNVGQGDGGFCAINPQNPLTQYATAQFLGVFRTRDEWATTIKTTPSTGSDAKAFIAPIAISPSQPRYVYAGTNYLWRWDETAATWTARLGGQALAGAAHYVTAIAVSPSDAGRIYTGSNDGQLWMTTDGGSTWQLAGAGIVSLPARAISCIAVNPTDPSDLFVGLSGTGTGHLWRCANTQAGPARTWTDLSGAGATALPDVPVNAVALDPDTPTSSLYVATDVGVMASQDGGATWANATQPLGLPNVQVNDLVVAPGTRTLYAGTYGRGIWRIGLPSGVATRLTAPYGSGSPGSSVTLSATLTKSLDASPLQGKTLGFTVAGTSIGSATTGATGVAAVPYTVADTFASASVGVGAAFAGDGVYGASNAIGILTVTPAVTALAAADAAGSIGGTVSLAVTLTRATDGAGVVGRSVSFAVDGTAVGSAATAAGGVAMLAYMIPAATPVGPHSIGATFAGDALYGSSSGAGTLTVDGSGLPATYLTVPNRAGYGPSQSVPLGATLKRVSDDAVVTGKAITFRIDGSGVGSATTNSSGIALVYWTTPATFSGTHEIRAEFAGDAGYLACHGIGYINPGFPSATTLTVTSATAAFGQHVTLSATLTRTYDGAAPTGRAIAFALGGAPIGVALTASDGVAAFGFTLPDTIPAGANALAASFAGDAVYAASSAIGTLTATAAGTTTTAHNAAGTAGAATTLTATLTRNTDGGPLVGRTVAFAVASTPVGSATTIASGAVTLAYTLPDGLALGAHALGASFVGEAAYAASSGSATLTVEQGATALAAADVAGALGASVTLAATLTRSSDGAPLAGRSVAFSVDAAAVGSGDTDPSGVASLPYTVPDGLALGAHTLGASFVGEAAYAASSGSATLTVEQGATALAASDVTGRRSASVTLSATLRRSVDGAPLAGRSLAFAIDGTPTAAATTATSGVAAAPYTIPAGATAGVHPILVAFAGEEAYAAAAASATLTVDTTLYATTVTVPSRINIGALQRVPLGAFLRRASDNAAVGNRWVAFKVDGTGVGGAATNSSGIALMYWTTPATFHGTHEVRAEFTGDTLYLASTGVGWINPGVTAPTSLSMPPASGAYAQTAYLSAVLAVTSDGSPVVGRTVAFTLLGSAMGSAMTDAAGVASLAFTVADSMAPTGGSTGALFAGDGSYSSAAGSGTFTPAPAPATLSVHPASGLVGATVVLNATLTRTSDGLTVAGASVAFTVDGTVAGTRTTDAAGQAAISFAIPTDWAAGAHTIHASFAGDSRSGAASGSADLTAQANSTKVYVVDRTSKIKGYTVLKAYLYLLNNTPVAGKPMTIRVAGVTLGADTTRPAGYAQLGYTVPEDVGIGVRTIRGEFGGDGGYLASASNGKLTVTAGDLYIWPYVRSVTRGTTQPLKAYVRSLPDYVIQPGKSLTFSVNGSAVGVGVVGSDGWASVNWAIPAVEALGAHTATAAFAGDAWYAPVSVNTDFNVVQ